MTSATETIIAIGSDHRGHGLKARFIGWLEASGYLAKDLGTHGTERCDALDYARALAADLEARGAGFGVLICGSGQAMAMTANRYSHLRAALCGSVAMAKTTREHNDANVLCRPARRADASGRVARGPQAQAFGISVGISVT